jgi:ABC-2 type transport system ATP-binding protein
VLEGILEAMPEAGGSVVYASHLVHDVERIADRVVVLDEGRKVLDEPLESLRASTRRVTAVFDEAPPPHASLPNALHRRTDGRTLTVVARGGDEDLQAAATGLGAAHVEATPIDLEEILVACLAADEEVPR